MDKQIHIHLHLGDTTLSLGDLIGKIVGASDTPPVAATPTPANADVVAPPTPVARDVRTFTVTEYDSGRQAFALGSKLYSDGRPHNRSHENYVASHDVRIDVAGGRVVNPVNEANGVEETRYFALLRDGDGFALGRNSFEDASRTRTEYPQAASLVKVAQDRDGELAFAAA